MKKSYLFFTVIFSVLFSIISCNGITDVYSKNNYNVILTVPGGNSSRVIDDYSIDDIRSKINKCQVNVYPVDEDDEAITDSPIYSDKKAAGSVIKLRVDPGIKYVVGITPYWIVDKNKDSEGYKIHNEELSDIFMVNPDSNTPCKVTVTFQKNDFFDFDGILDQWAYVLTGVGSFAQPVQNYNDLLTAISKTKNSNMPTKIYVGCDSYSTRTMYIECFDTINISDKNIIFAPGNYGNSTYFTGPSGKPIFKIGKNGKLSTKHEIKVSCTDNTAFEVTSNGYLNFTGEILNASPDTPVILATDNAEVRIHTENNYDNTITVADDTNVSGDGLGSYGKSSINVKNNAKLLLSAGATLRNISVVSTEKASVSIKDSEIMTLQAPAVSVGKETTLRMNNVTFANCIASETNESAEGNYDGIVIIDEVTEGDWNDSKVKPGYFEFSNISCNSCSGDFIVSGADIILGGENNFDSIFMRYYYNITNQMDNCFPRIFLKDDFAPNPVKPDPIKLCFKKSIFNVFGNYKFLINGFNVNGYDRYNVKTGLVEECEIYPEFFLTTEGKNISTLNKDYNLTEVITLSDSITNCRLNNEGIICSKFVSADGGGFNTINTVENIIIENTNVTPIVVTSKIQYANHFWGSTKGLSEITNSNSGVFPFFKVETSEPVIFDGSTGRIKFIAEGSQDILGQAVFVNIPESLKEDNQKMDLTLRNVDFSLRECNPVIMSTPNSTVTLDNCSFDVQSNNQNTTGPETCHIVVYGNDCTVKLTGSYPQMLKIYIAGQNFKLIVGPDLYMTEDVNLSFIFEDSVKVYYPKLSDAYKILGYSGGGRIKFQSNLQQQ